MSACLHVDIKPGEEEDMISYYRGIFSSHVSLGFRVYVVDANVVVAAITLVALANDGVDHAGKAHVWLKDSIFYPSNPIRHATQLLDVRKNAMANVRGDDLFRWWFRP